MKGDTVLNVCVNFFLVKVLKIPVILRYEIQIGGNYTPVDSCRHESMWGTLKFTFELRN